MVTARKANKTLGEHAEAHEAVTRLGSNKQRPIVKAQWTIDNIHEHPVGQGIIEYLKRHETISMREINMAANRLTKIAGAEIKEGRARDLVARIVGYNDYDSINVTVRSEVPVRNQVQRMKANRSVKEELMEDEDESIQQVIDAFDPSLSLALQSEISKRRFRFLGKDYREYVNRTDPKHPLTLMQAYNHLAKQLGYPDYHSMPRQYPIINLNYVD